MRLIDGDAMVTALRVAAKHMHTSDSEWLKGYAEGLNAASNAIEEAPTVDAVPVVRCKDCIGKVHWYKDDYGCTICGLSGFLGIEENDFCSCGERMTI